MSAMCSRSGSLPNHHSFRSTRKFARPGTALPRASRRSAERASPPWLSRVFHKCSCALAREGPSPASERTAPRPRRCNACTAIRSRSMARLPARNVAACRSAIASAGEGGNGRCEVGRSYGRGGRLVEVGRATGSDWFTKGVWSRKSIGPNFAETAGVLVRRRWG